MSVVLIGVQWMQWFTSSQPRAARQTVTKCEPQDSEGTLPAAWGGIDGRWRPAEQVAQKVFLGNPSWSSSCPASDGLLRGVLGRCVSQAVTRGASVGSQRPVGQGSRVL